MTAALDLTHLAHLPRRIRESRPTLQRFNPEGIPYQRDVLRLVRRDFDYSQGNLEILLSGSYGSAKSVLLAHLAISHCMLFARSRVAICRRALPDLKGTLFKEIVEHLADEARIEGMPNVRPLKEGRDYLVNYTRGAIRFRNGSEIIPVFWADRRYKRVRSLKISMALIEEGTENDDGDKEGFEELKARIRRLPHVRENVLVVATNPDSPAHWLHEYFIEPNIAGREHPTRRVFYSRTESNVYLSPVYLKQLRTDTDPRRAARYLDGLWIELSRDRVYYQYDAEKNWLPKATYAVSPAHPVFICWDFNIGVGKPLSVAIMQFVAPAYHFFGEVVIEGVRTEDACDELAARGFLDLNVPRFIVAGDAAGKHRDTRNKRNDYEIISEFLKRYRRKGDGRPLSFDQWVPLANPAVRERHNVVNAMFLNADGQRRCFVYGGAPTLHRGFRLVQLVKGGDYIEDDSKAYQHVTTSASYGIMAQRMFGERQPQTTRML